MVGIQDLKEKQTEGAHIMTCKLKLLAVAYSSHKKYCNP